jgi:hypothetical protein
MSHKVASPELVKLVSLLDSAMQELLSARIQAHRAQVRLQDATGNYNALLLQLVDMAKVTP